MEHVDLRKLNRGELTQVRRQVVRLKEMGKPEKVIEESTGVRQNRISEIWTAYQQKGDSSLEPKKRGFQSLFNISQNAIWQVFFRHASL